MWLLGQANLVVRFSLHFVLFGQSGSVLVCSELRKHHGWHQYNISVQFCVPPNMGKVVWYLRYFILRLMIDLKRHIDFLAGGC